MINRLHELVLAAVQMLITLTIVMWIVTPTAMLFAAFVALLGVEHLMELEA
jgi:hypothetical protein